MKTLFTGSFEKTSKLIFDLYDFDRDGLISKEDIRTVLSYVPLKTSTLITNSESYKDRIESQDELHEILSKCFESVKKNSINYEQFVSIIENINSDIYIFILVFILEKRPFSNQGLVAYEKTKNSLTSRNSFLGANLPCNLHKSNSPNSKMIASPNLESKFSPSVALSKSPKGDKFSIKNSVDFENQDSSEFKGRFARDRKHLTVREDKNLAAKLLELQRQKEMTPKVNDPKEISNKVPNRKLRNNLKGVIDDSTNTNIASSENQKVNYNESEIMITPAVKKNFIVAKPDFTSGEKGSNKIETNTKLPSELSDQYYDYIEEDELTELEPVKHQGYLFKFTEENKKLKKIWFKLFDKDFYYFKSESDLKHKGMHNLSGTYIKEEKPNEFNDELYYAFSVSYSNKVRYYYSNNENDIKSWVRILKKTTGYSDLSEIYEVREKLGKGKFGLVKLGVHKQTGKKVAIKIMSKKEMKNQDLELVKTEIEILRICQHPNIIRLYDVFENIDYVYAIMEYCSGGDLFTYIEKRGFRLPEPRACQIIHKLCTAIYYIHSYGITHRDLKPENILMTDESDEADIRLLDFGLSKIIGPNENCKEPYGTLSYVAPEVLLEKPYTKSVDLWSIGITTYLLLAGVLPFDHESSEREIARQTIQDHVRWGTIWKKISSEAKAFVESKIIYKIFRLIG
jgi:tRNA A-37 threonylcarbamoyl transferase component Bud32